MHDPARRRVRSARFAALAVFVGALGILSILAACSDDPTPAPTPPTDGTGGAHDGPSSRIDPEDARFLERRARMTIMLSGGFLGRHKPCGCTAPQLGGLERQAVMVDVLRERANGNLLGLSLGWNLKDNGEAQQAAKAELLREAMSLLGFGGLLLGDTDLGETAMIQPYGGAGVNTPIPPVNVILPEGSAATRTNTLSVKLRDVPVRVMSLVDPSRADDLKSDGRVVEVLGTTAPFSALKPDPNQLWVVACRLDTREAYDVVASAVRRLGPAIIVDFGGVAGVESFEGIPFGPDMQPAIVSVDEHGKAVGVLDFLEDEDGNRTIAYRTIRLVPEFEERESPLKEEVKGLIYEYLDLVREREYLADFPSFPDGNEHYVGSLACVRCHDAIYKDWNQTAHAGAIPTLVKGHYEWDPECVRCHVVGWNREGDQWYRFDSGFADVSRTPHMGGVGCENCHGPGSAHVQDPQPGSIWNPKGEGRLEAWRRRCETCHDLENSHGFTKDWMSYFEQVGHRSVPSDRRTVLPGG